MNITQILGITLPRRHNTRRNRARAIRRWSNQQDEYYAKQPRHESANENEVCIAAHLADFIQRGGTLKAYSSWSEAGVRHLSKLLDDYNHRRLPGQLIIALSTH